MMAPHAWLVCGAGNDRICLHALLRSLAGTNPLTAGAVSLATEVLRLLGVGCVKRRPCL